MQYLSYLYSDPLTKQYKTKTTNLSVKKYIILEQVVVVMVGEILHALLKNDWAEKVFKLLF